MGSRLNPVLFSPSYPSPHKQQDRSSRPPSTQSSGLMRLSPLPRNGNPVTLRCTSVLSATQQCSVSDLTGQRCCLHIKHRVQISAASWPEKQSWSRKYAKNYRKRYSHVGCGHPTHCSTSKTCQKITGNNFGNK